MPAYRAPAGFRAVSDAFVEAGWGTPAADPAFAMCSGLNEGAQAAIHAVEYGPPPARGVTRRTTVGRYTLGDGTWPRH